jgi:hypothetical protein
VQRVEEQQAGLVELQVRGCIFVCVFAWPFVSHVKSPTQESVQRVEEQQAGLAELLVCGLESVCVCICVCVCVCVCMCVDVHLSFV